MSKRRLSGGGMVRKREDGHWRAASSSATRIAEKNGYGRKKRKAKKATGLRGAHSGGLIFSVCGLLCGQSVGHLSLYRSKATKSKEKPPFSNKKGGFRGAAG